VNIGPISPVPRLVRDVGFEWMRASAIVMVLVIHSVTRFTDNPWAVWVSVVCRPCIAMFLFQSGYYFAQAGMGGLQRRLERLITPYLVVSIPIVAYQALRGSGIITLARDLAIGNTSGIYYFVFLIAILYGIAAMARVCEWGAMSLVIASMVSLMVALAHSVATRLVVPGMPEWFSMYEYRTPLLWACPFLWGLTFAKTGLLPHLRQFRWHCMAIAILMFAAMSAWHWQGMGWHNPYNDPVFILYSLAVTIAYASVQCPPAKLATSLSLNSYAIYLFHIAGVWAVQALLLRLGPPLPAIMATVACFAASAAFPFLLIMCLKHWRPALLPFVGAAKA